MHMCVCIVCVHVCVCLCVCVCVSEGGVQPGKEDTHLQAWIWGEGAHAFMNLFHHSFLRLVFQCVFEHVIVLV